MLQWISDSFEPAAFNIADANKRLNIRTKKMNSLVDEIRSCEYLYLDALTEPNVNEIRIVLLEGVVGPLIGAAELTSEQDPVLRSLLVGSRDILCLPDCAGSS